MVPRQTSIRLAERFKPGDGHRHEALGGPRAVKGGYATSWEDIGLRFGITGARAQQICEEAEAKIATALAADLLASSGKTISDGYLS